MVSKCRAVSLLASFVLAVFGLATPTMGQAPNRPTASTDRQPQRPDWGGSDLVLYAVGRDEFAPRDSTTEYQDVTLTTTGSRVRHSIDFAGFFHATPHIPSGALLTYLELDYCDSAAQERVVLFFEECNYLGAGCTQLGLLNSNTGPPGCDLVSADLTAMGYTVNNNLRRLFLTAVTESGNPSTALVGAYVGYKLQVSPAPGSATFADVPTTHPYFRFVEALVDAGITAGCGGGNYCVNAPITRGEMAVFLSAALGLHFPN